MLQFQNILSRHVLAGVNLTFCILCFMTQGMSSCFQCFSIVSYWNKSFKSYIYFESSAKPFSSNKLTGRRLNNFSGENRFSSSIYFISLSLNLSSPSILLLELKLNGTILLKSLDLNSDCYINKLKKKEKKAFCIGHWNIFHLTMSIVNVINH